MRDWAAFGLRQLQTRARPARDALAALLEDPDHATRSEALHALADAGDQRALPVLRRRLEDGDDPSRLELEAAAALAAPDLHPALQELATDWAGDQDEFTDLLATALARCAPEAAVTAQQVEYDVRHQVRQVLGATNQVRLDGGYPRTVLTITGNIAGAGHDEDLHLPLWDEGQRPGEYPTGNVIDAVSRPGFHGHHGLCGTWDTPIGALSVFAPCHAHVMTDHVWQAMRPPHDLGVIVHGPVVLAGAPGIAAGLRAAFAHPGGLHLLLTYRAVGERAVDAGSWSYGRIRRYPGPTADNPYTEPELHVTVNDSAGPARTSGPTRNSDDAFSVDASYWISELSRDDRVLITLEWPYAGLPRTGTVLTLQGLDDLDDRVLRLL